METATTAAQVAVLGNGPVGQTTALLLARWGIRVLLLDCRLERDPIGSKAICQQRDVLEIWDSVGVGRTLADEGVTWGCARTFYRGRELSAERFADAGLSSFPPFVNISQARTEELLDRRIAEEPLIEVRWGYEVTRLDQNSRRVQIDCTVNGRNVSFGAEYAVAALGSRATAIRQALGVSFDGRSFDDKFLICDIRAELPGWADERRFYFDPEWNPGRQVLIHPCPDSTFRIDWQVPGDYDIDAEQASGALDDRIRQIVGDRPYEIVWQSVYRFHARLVDRMRVGRVLLAGDCAHIVSPFGARGLNSGVGDAENAAWKLAFVLRGWAGEDLLESYQVERHAAALENLEVTSATMDFLVPQTPTQHVHRRKVLDAAGTDLVARGSVDSGRLAEPFWYVDSPLTTANPSRPFVGRPARGTLPAAVPGVLLPDFPVTVRASDCTRLREIARSGLLLLAGAAVDLQQIRQIALNAVSAPIRIYPLKGIDHTGLAASALTAKPNELWVIRPDAHIAAVLDGADTTSTNNRRAIASALRSALGHGAACPD